LRAASLGLSAQFREFSNHLLSKTCKRRTQHKRRVCFKAEMVAVERKELQKWEKEGKKEKQLEGGDFRWYCQTSSI
jgi:hypothetical protein